VGGGKKQADWSSSQQRPIAQSKGELYKPFGKLDVMVLLYSVVRQAEFGEFGSMERGLEMQKEWCLHLLYG